MTTTVEIKAVHVPEGKKVQITHHFNEGKHVYSQTLYEGESIIFYPFKHEIEGKIHLTIEEI